MYPSDKVLIGFRVCFVPFCLAAVCQGCVLKQDIMQDNCVSLDMEDLPKIYFCTHTHTKKGL